MPRYRIEFEAIKPEMGVAIMEVIVANIKLHALNGDLDGVVGTRLEEEPAAPVNKAAPPKGKVKVATEPPPALANVADEDNSIDDLEEKESPEKLAMLAALSALATGVGKEKVRAILKKLNVDAISEIPSDRYAAVTNAANKLVAQHTEEPPY